MNKKHLRIKINSLYLYSDNNNKKNKHYEIN
jgi:hypothetical protein